MFVCYFFFSARKSRVGICIQTEDTVPYLHIVRLFYARSGVSGKPSKKFTAMYDNLMESCPNMFRVYATSMINLHIHYIYAISTLHICYIYIFFYSIRTYANVMDATVTVAA